MLTRRHIRIVVLQSLYGYFQRDEKDLAKTLEMTRKNLDSIYDLYLYELKGFLLVLQAAENRIESNKKKYIPTKEDITPNLRFVNNSVLRALADNVDLNNQFEDRKIIWGDYKDVFSKIFKDFSKTEEYAEYLKSRPGLAADKKIVKFLYGNYFSTNENIHQIYEEMNLNWADYFDAAQMMVVKTIKILMDINGKVISKINFPPGVAEKIANTGKIPLTFSEKEQKVTVHLFKDSSDKQFGPELLTKTIKNSERFDELIIENTKNWDADRIAHLDHVLMKMALAEFTQFPEIPLKVSLNEYIELSKMYSTPKSGQFINGILDKIAMDLKKTGEIKKIGRGLL